MKRLYLMLIVSLILCCISMAQPPEDPLAKSSTESDTVEVYDFFAENEPLEMILSFNLREFLKTKLKPEFVNAMLQIRFNENDSVIIPVTIKARGEMRRNYCQFPPVLLKFNNKTQINGGYVKGSLKIVTPCMLSGNYQDYVLREYVVYQAYNRITPYSLRTRLINLKLSDTQNPDKEYDVIGFVIEDADDMAKRNNAILVKNKNLGQVNMVPGHMNRLALFNFMVGNTDWAVPGLHNIKLIKPLNEFTNKAIPVPYDFDYTGLVNASYAAPPEALPIKSVSERYYLGLCENNNNMQSTIEEFRNSKGEILGTIQDFGLLSDRNKKIAINYIDGFYKMYQYDQALIHVLNRTCKR